MKETNPKSNGNSDGITNCELRIDKSNGGRLLLENGEWRTDGDGDRVGNLMPTR